MEKWGGRWPVCAFVGGRKMHAAVSAVLRGTITHQGDMGTCRRPCSIRVDVALF